MTANDPNREWHYSITFLNGNVRQAFDGVTKQGTCTTRDDLINWIAARLRVRFSAVEVHCLERNDL